MNPISPNRTPSSNFDVSVNPISDMEIQVQEKKDDVEISVTEKHVIPDNNEKDGNTMIGLENLLIKEFHPDVNPATLTLTQRNNYMKDIRPHISKFHGKLPSIDPKRADASIKYETWEFTYPKRDKKGQIIYGQDGKPEVFSHKHLKAKVTWQIEVNVNGVQKTLECEQYIKTPREIDPTNPKKTGIAKHHALLDLKVHRKLHKKALLGENYSMDDISSKQLKQEDLTQALRETNLIIPKHRGGAYSLGKIHSLVGQDPAVASEIELDLGNRTVSLAIGYSAYYVTPNSVPLVGRKLQYYSDPEHKTKSDTPTFYSRWVKEAVYHESYSYMNQKDMDPDAIGTGHHYSTQASNSIIDDPEIAAFDTLSKTTFNSKQELKEAIEKQNKSMEDLYADWKTKATLTEDKFKKYEKESLKNSEQEFSQLLKRVSQEEVPQHIETLQSLDEKLTALAAATEPADRLKIREEIKNLRNTLGNLPMQVRRLKKGKEEIDRARHNIGIIEERDAAWFAKLKVKKDSPINVKNQSILNRINPLAKDIDVLSILERTDKALVP